MKKLYTLLVASVIGMGAFAQNYDLQLSLVNPTSGSTVPGTASTSVDFTLTNNGPTTIPTGDTLWFGYADSGFNFFSLSNVSNQASGFILGADLTSGSSLNATTDLGGPFSLDLSGFANGETITVICLGAGADALDQSGDAQELNFTDNGDSFNISQASGLEEESSSNISVFPVPADKVLNVASAEPVSNISIVGLDGRVLASEANTNQIDVSTIPSGVYVYVIETTNGTVVKNKFVKQ